MEKSTRTPTAQELKDHFMSLAWPLVGEYVNAALGHSELKSTSSACREEVWELIKTLMLKSSNKLEMQVDSPRDVIEAVSGGHCTIQEAEQLLAMFKQVQEIENPTNNESGNNGVNIVIQSASENRAMIDTIEVPTIEYKS